MAEINTWQRYFVDILNFLESQGNSVRDFKRSYISGSKKDRVKPTLTDIYEKCKDRLDDGDSDSFVKWFNSQSFKIKSGLKIITLRCETDTGTFEQYLRQLFSYWDPKIEFVVPNNASSKPGGSGPISKKSIDKAMKHLKGIDPKKLSQLAATAPKNQMESLTNNLDVQKLSEQLQDDPDILEFGSKLKL